MQLVTVGQKYQVVIPKEAREITQKIKPGRKVVVTPLDEWSVSLKVKPTAEEWTEAALGMDKKSWKGIDPTKYLSKIRNEWEKRLSKINS